MESVRPSGSGLITVVGVIDSKQSFNMSSDSEQVAARTRSVKNVALNSPAVKGKQKESEMSLPQTSRTNALRTAADVGRDIGLSGLDLADFVRKNVSDQEEQEYRLAKLESDERSHDRDRELQKSVRVKENVPSRIVVENVKLPVFDETKDDLDDYLRRFERIASAQSWPEENWAVRLSSVLRGKALQLYNSLDDSTASQYNRLKKALRERFRLTADTYRQRLRNAKLQEGETFTQFTARLHLSLRRWIETAGKNQSFEDVCDVMVLEQMMNSVPPEIATFVREHEPKSAEEAASFAQLYVEAHARPQQKSFKNPTSKLDDNAKSLVDSTPQSKPVERRICHYCKKPGHIKKDCRKYKTDNGIHCVEVRREERSDFEIPELCLDCSKNHFQPRCRVWIDGRPGEGLRDTGADVVVVRSSFVPPQAYTDREMKISLAETSVTKDLPIVHITVVTPMFEGQIEAIVMENPPADLIIGNRVVMVDGTCKEIPVYRVPKHCNVLTRAQSARKERPLPPLPVPKPGLGEVKPEDLRAKQAEDPSLSALRALADRGEVKKSGRNGQVKYIREKGILIRCYSDQQDSFKQVIVPKSLRGGVMSLAHDSVLGGHMAARRTLDRIWRQFYWPGICSEVRRFCASCDQCQKMSPKGRVRKVPLVQMPLIDEPFRRVGVDIVGPIIPASDNGNRFILTMVDYATRYPEAIVLPSIEATRVAEALLEMWSRIGIPTEVLTDRGTQFTSDIMQQVNRLLSIRHLCTTPYHAQTNGLVERYNGTLKASLRKLCQEQPRVWDRYIPALLFAYREAPQESTGFSPFELLYGRRVRGPMAILRQAWTDEQAPEEVQTTATYIVELRNRIQETCQLAQDSLKKAAKRYAQHFNKKAVQRIFHPGDKVLLLLPRNQNKL